MISGGGEGGEVALNKRMSERVAVVRLTRAAQSYGRIVLSRERWIREGDDKQHPYRRQATRTMTNSTLLKAKIKTSPLQLVPFFSPVRSLLLVETRI